MHQGFRTLVPPSSVSHCCEAYLWGPGKPALCVAKHSVLEVYQMRSSASPGGAPLGGQPQQLTLERVYPLHGAVEAMVATRFPGKEGESLVLGFGEAKISVVEWDRRANDLQVRALHLLEEPVLADARGTSDDGSTHILIRVDPGGPARQPQCIVVLVHRRFLFVLPFARRQGGARTFSGKEEPAPFPLEHGAPPLDLHAKEMSGVRDICLLHGLYNPTALVLHEKNSTWAGRLTLLVGEDPRTANKERRMLTCAATAVSISLTPGRAPDYTTMLMQSRLPYNAHVLSAVGSAPHGALCIGPNTIVHVAATRENQGYAGYVNRYGEEELTSDAGLATPSGAVALRTPDGGAMPCYASSEPDAPEVKLVMELTNARVAQLDPVRWLMVLGDGDAALLHLGVANGVVTQMWVSVCGGMHYFEAAARRRQPIPGSWQCPAPSCLTTLGESRLHVFIGSRLGDSLFLSRTPWDPQKGGVTFEKLATFLNTGPVIDMALADSSTDPLSGPDDDGLTHTFPAPSLHMGHGTVPMVQRPTQHSTYGAWLAGQEAVLATGAGHDGAICILSRTVRPFELCRQQIPATGIWSLATGDASVGPPLHDYLVVAASDAPLRVFGTDDSEEEPSLKELTASALPGLHRGGPGGAGQTVMIASMLGGQCILQVTATDCVLLDASGVGVATHDVIALNERVGARVHAASASDGHALLLLTNGVLFLASPMLSGGELRLEMQLLPLPTGFGFVTACSLYEPPPACPYLCPHVARGAPGATDRRVFAVVAWSGGAVQFYLLPSWRCLYHTEGALDRPLSMAHLAPDSQIDEPELPVHHVQGVWLGRTDSGDPSPHLMMLTTDQQLNCYRAYIADESTSRYGKTAYGMLSSLRWQKVRHLYLPGPPQPQGAAGAEPPPPQATLAPVRNDEGLVTDIFPTTPVQPHFYPFNNIFGGAEGVYCRGDHGAAWGFSERGLLRVHPAQDEVGGVTAFAPFNSECCKQGFVYATPSLLRVAQLTWHRRMNFRVPVPCRKILLRSSPHFVVHDEHFRTHTLVSSTTAPFRPVKTSFDSECDNFVDERLTSAKAQPVSVSEGIPVPKAGRYELLLYSAITWKPFSSVPLLENERVLCCANVEVARPDAALVGRGLLQSMHGVPLPKETVAIQACGTAFPVSEDVACRGRLLLLRIRPGRHHDDRILDVEFEHNTKGPVSAVSSTGGYLLATIGARVNVFFYDWQHKRLVLTSWCETGTMSVGMTTGVKNLVLSGDLLHSATVMRLEGGGGSLSMVARDLNQLRTSACEFVIDRAQCGVLVSDMAGNLGLYQVAPAQSGKALLPIADAHIGAPTSRFVRVSTLKPGNEAGAPGERERRSAVIFGTSEGSVMVVQPLTETAWRNMLWMHGRLCSELPHTAGLHPRAWRLWRGVRRKLPEQKRRAAIVDLDLILDRFPSQPILVQQELAVGAGLRHDKLAQTLVALCAELPLL